MQWHAREIVEDQLNLPLPANLLAGEYAIMIGLYDSLTQERLPVAQLNAREPDRAYAATVTIQK